MNKSRLGTRYDTSVILKSAQKKKIKKPTLSDFDHMVLKLDEKPAFNNFLRSTGLSKFIKP